MSLSVVCQGCGQRLQVPDGYSRRKIRCPECGIYAELPAPSTRNRRARPPAPPSEPAEDVLLSVMAEPRLGLPAHAEPPPRAIPLAEEPLAEEDDSRQTYDVASGQERKCPGCNHALAPEAVVCVACGLHVETGEKAVQIYQSRSWQWEAGMPFHRRRNLFILCQVIFLGLGLIAAVAEGYVSAFLSSWLTFTLMLAFLLGTYDRLDMTRNKRGRVVLTKTWRICFIPRPAETIALREYEGVTAGMADDTNIMDWLIALVLLPFGIVPGIIWWYCAIQSDTYYVALCKNHGYPELTLYRGWNQGRAKEIAATLHDVAGLPYENR